MALDLGPEVQLERDGSAAWLTLNRPHRLNALEPVTVALLGRYFDALESDDGVSSVILTGAGRAFCAGADLSFLDAIPIEHRPAETERFLRDATGLMSRLERFPKPVIAALNGIATAGGLELLLCCDLVVAAETARIADGHANYGLIPGGGASVRLPRRIGVGRAKYLFFTGEMVSAAEMQAAGLVNVVVPVHELREAAAGLAVKLGAKSPLGLRRMKELADGAFDASLHEALEREQHISREHTLSYDRNEGIAAFNERRAPIFLGR